MGANGALAALQAFHDSGDRDDRGVAGEDGVRPHVLFDFSEDFLLERQILKHGFDHVVGVAHRVAELGNRRDPLDRRLVVAEVFEVGEDAPFGAVEARFDRVVDGHVVPGEREYLRDAVAHQPGADHRDARFRHAHPAV